MVKQMVVITMVIKMITKIMEDKMITKIMDDKMITKIMDNFDDHHLNIVRLPHQAGVGVAKLSGLLA